MNVIFLGMGVAMRWDANRRRLVNDLRTIFIMELMTRGVGIAMWWNTDRR